MTRRALKSCLAGGLALFVVGVGSGLARGESRPAASPTQVRPLLIGSQVPELTLRSADGSAVNLGQVLSKKPAIVILYRGGW